MCIDYRKLNAATKKDHFPLPFIDKILERLQSTLSSIFSMGIRDIIKFPSIPTIKARLHSHARMEHTHVEECRSGCVTHPLHSNGA
jgi:hypothetical protein